jgi:hypothetical protein
MSTPTCNLQQTAFLLSMAASMENATGDTGSPPALESALAQAINGFLSNSTVQSYVGDWTLAWGPAVYQEGSEDVVTNAMFVAQGSDTAGNPVYVVAIGATNFNSLYDVFTEDGDVTLTAWPYSIPSSFTTPNVTQGTLDGLAALLAMEDPTTGDSLQTALGNAASTSATLVFTGHSLGGALAPALGLALFAETLDTSDWGAVYVYPTASPTVGDVNYSTLWSSVFPVSQDSSGETWNQIVWNTLDVVPQAWASLSQINTLYPSSDITWTPCLNLVQQGLVAIANGAGGTFVQPANTSLAGTFSAWTGASSSSPMVTYFLVEMLYQHTYAYFGLLGVSNLLQYFPSVIDPTAVATAPTAIQLLCSDLTGDSCSESQRSSACGASSAGSGSANAPARSRRGDPVPA